MNIFVTSGGGQWAVQTPIMMPAGMALDIEPSVIAMVIAWGDALGKYDSAFFGHYQHL